jgi:kumamolisin
MKFHLASCLITISMLLATAAPSPAQEARGPRIEGHMFIPESSIMRVEDAGIVVHTNHRILMKPGSGLGPSGGMTPAQISSFYGVIPKGSGTIVIVDAYDYPTALNDFNVFAAQFGLPFETSANVKSSSNKVFQVIYASGTEPPADSSWNGEEALDIEWAHALAPDAKIVLVEAASSSYPDLFSAIQVATSVLNAKQVSMSWGSIEFSGETYYDKYFNASRGPIYFGSIGDSGGVVEYPACSPYVVASGGTSVATNSDGTWAGETGWSNGGGGNSQYEGKPSWQHGISGMGSHRGTPDLSSDADTSTGVSVYISVSYGGNVGWLVMGGTSVSTPCLAAMMNSSGATFTNTASFLSSLYADFTRTGYANFRDIVSGGHNNDAGVGWDFATGIGTPLNSHAF